MLNMVKDTKGADGNVKQGHKSNLKYKNLEGKELDQVPQGISSNTLTILPIHHPVKIFYCLLSLFMTPSTYTHNQFLFLGLQKCHDDNPTLKIVHSYLRPILTNDIKIHFVTKAFLNNILRFNLIETIFRNVI